MPLPARATSTPASGTTLKVGATPAPHAEILEQVKPILAEEGITLDIVEYQRLQHPQRRQWRTAPWTPTTSSTSPT